MQHPIIDQIERTGYPYSEKREAYGTDALGREVYSGEEILTYQDEFFLVEELSADAKEILEMFGATYKTVK